jgi:hypothetical protein
MFGLVSIVSSLVPRRRIDETSDNGKDPHEHLTIMVDKSD